MHACDSSTQGDKSRWISEFDSSLAYRVSSRRAKATQRNIVLKTNKKSGSQNGQGSIDQAQTKKNL